MWHHHFSDNSTVFTVPSGKDFVSVLVCYCFVVQIYNYDYCWRRVLDILKEMKSGKSAGHDGLAAAEQ